MRPRVRDRLRSRVLPAACFLVMSWWVVACLDLDHLTNGTRPTDGGQPDAAQPDDGSSSEASPDAAEANPCAAQHLFCDDFESGLRLGAAATDWEIADQRQGGAVVLSTAHARSGTHAIKATIPRNDALVTLFATLHKQLSIGTWRRMRVQTAIFLVRPAWASGDQGTLALVLGAYVAPGSGASPAWNFGLVDPNGSQMYVTRPSAAVATGTFPTPYDRWFVLSVDWDPAGSGTFTASIDGTPFDQRTLTLDTGMTAPGSGARFSVDVGVARFDGAGNVPTPPIEAYFDDVIVDAL